MKFFYDNLIDYDGVIVDASSEIRRLPAENVIDEMARKVWRTKGELTTEWIKFDLGLAKSADHVIIHNHTLIENDSDLRIEANTTSDFTAPAFSDVMAYADNTILWPFTGGSKFYRYWRFKFTKWASDISSRQIGRIFLGGHHATVEGPDFDGYNVQKNDLTRKQKSLGGQVYAERIDRYHNLRLDFSKCSENQVSWFRTIANAAGESKSMFVQVDPTYAPEVWYVKLAKPLRTKVAGFDTNFYWDLSLELEEML